jgi:hypothetical protein
MPLAVACVCAIVAACAGAAEQAVIGQFFSASRLLDRTSLDGFATVVFDPRTQGIVTDFSVQSISPEQRKPLPPTSLARARQGTKAEDGTLAKSTEEYRIALSIDAGGRAALDVTKYEGELISKDVTVAASVRLPDGATVQKTLVVTLQRARLRGSPEITGRWIVTHVLEN